MLLQQVGSQLGLTQDAHTAGLAVSLGMRTFPCPGLLSWSLALWCYNTMTLDYPFFCHYTMVLSRLLEKQINASSLGGKSAKDKQALVLLGGASPPAPAVKAAGLTGQLPGV